MAFQGSGELEDQLEEPEDTLRVSPAEEMPVDGPPALEEPEPLLLPWDRFSSWLHCICVVGFDLELGQAVEVQKTCHISAVICDHWPASRLTVWKSMENPASICG